jgi:hypothetical protein
VWAFGTSSKDEAVKTCEFLGVAANDQNIGLILGLGGESGEKGVCVFKDRGGKLARVKVEFIYDFVLDIFDTNPEKDPDKMTRIIAEIFGDDAAGARRAMDAKDKRGDTEQEPDELEDDDPVPAQVFAAGPSAGGEQPGGRTALSAGR